MINFTKEEFFTLKNICQKWQVEYSAISDNSELFSVLVRIRHEMIKAIPTMNLAELQSILSETEFIGKKLTEVNDALAEEKNLTKELREKCLKNFE